MKKSLTIQNQTNLNSLQKTPTVSTQNIQKLSNPSASQSSAGKDKESLDDSGRIGIQLKTFLSHFAN
jgi:hypothetical protein